MQSNIKSLCMCQDSKEVVMHTTYLWLNQPCLFLNRSLLITKVMAKTAVDPMCTISSKILQHIYHKKASCMQHTYKATVSTYVRDGK